MKSFVQFGAGNIGRSFIGERFASAGYEIVFVDVDEDLINELNAIRSYRVVIKHIEAPDSEILVRGVRAINGRDIAAVAEAIREASCIATSVGMQALPRVAPLVAAGIRARASSGAAPIDIILAENIRNASDLFRSELDLCLRGDSREVMKYAAESVGLVETSIGKMVPTMPDEDRAVDPLWVFAEAYDTLIVDRTAFRGPLPEIDNLKPVESIHAYVDRKLFLHNFGHAAAAYLGFLAHPEITYVDDVLADERLRDGIRASMMESAAALHANYPTQFTLDDLVVHSEDLLHRMSNKALKDTVHRVGRDLTRKLGRNDRIIGAALLAAKHDLPFRKICAVAASAMLFRSNDPHGNPFPADSEFLRHYGNDVGVITREICGLSESSGDASVRRSIVEEFHRIQQARV